MRCSRCRWPLRRVVVMQRRAARRAISRMGTLAAPKTPRETVRFQLQLTGVGCWPTLGQLTVRSITFKAEVMLWWEVFEQRVHLAFLRHADDTGVHGKTSFSWDVDLSLFGCGLPLPAAIEDRMISGLVTTIMRSYNQMNPLVVDLRSSSMAKAAGRSSTRRRAYRRSGAARFNATSRR